MRAVVLSVSLAVLGAGCAELTFSELRVEELTATRAVVRFSTSVESSCEVELGLEGGPLDQRVTDPAMGPGQRLTVHQVALENLQPERTYQFRARAVDARGAAFTSELRRFTTPRGTAPARPNVALRSAGTSAMAVSSNWGGGDNDSSFGAHRAIDGDFATEWSSNGDGNAARLELDLGQTRTLSGFGFRSRSMGDGSSIVTRVGLSLDGRARLELDTPDPAQLYVLDFAATDARRAVIEVVTSTGGNTGAREVQLYAGSP